MRATTGLVACLTAAALLGSPAAGAPRKPRAQDRALAASAVLRLSDFPAGWTVGPRTDSARADRIRGGIPDCRHYQPIVVALRRQPESSDSFFHGSASVSSTVFVLSSAGAAQSTFTQLTASSVLRCLERFLGVVIAQSFFIRGSPARLQTVSVQSIPVVRAGDQTVGFRIVITLAAAGLSVPVYEDVVVLRAGRGIADFGFENPSTPLPQEQRDTLVNAVAGRLAGAR